MTSSVPTPESVFDLSGGRLCLDFANTQGGRVTEPIERLKSYADLVSWSRQAGTVSASAARRLLEESSRHPKRAAAVLERARELREAIYRIWVAEIRGEQAAAADLELLNSLLGKALSQQRLVREEHRYALGWRDDDALESILWPVAKSAAELLTSEEARLVRQCEAFASNDCAWLFIDETRNRSRRWCSMASCGNRAKARRHYHRARLS
ncbi:MAG TPA: ABATE domain-containing protein [Myxococcaceae bacterium]|nr:ABATE domain-containing protein [Myxococcaceae bacterium]